MLKNISLQILIYFHPNIADIFSASESETSINTVIILYYKKIKRANSNVFPHNCISMSLHVAICLSLITPQQMYKINDFPHRFFISDTFTDTCVRNIPSRPLISQTLIPYFSKIKAYFFIQFLFQNMCLYKTEKLIALV